MERPLPPVRTYDAFVSIRTAPLWGLRMCNRLIHDGLSFTLTEAIQRHAGQATSVTRRYAALNAAQKAQVLAFLNSL